MTFRFIRPAGRRTQDPRLAVAVLLISLQGCSPYLFSDEIARFDASTEQLAGSVETMRTSIADGPGKRGFWTALRRFDAVELSDGCAVRLPEPCQVLIDGEEVDALSKEDVEALEAIKVFGAFRRYAAGLKAVTRAEDRAAFDAANAGLASSVGGLIKVVPLPAAQAASAMAEAAVRAGGAVVGFALDTERRKALEAAVLRVDPFMDDLKDELAGALDDIAAAQAISLRIRADRAAEALRRSRGAAERRRLVEEVFALTSGIRALDTADAGAVATRLAEAHAALATALQTAEPDLGETLGALRKFADAAAGLRKAIEPL